MSEQSDPIERIKDSNGDLVLDFSSRIGARPYARYVDGEWDLMSLTHAPTPQYGEDNPDAEHGINTEVHTADLEPDPDDWSEDELREMALQSRYPGDDVDGHPGDEVIPFEESPFPDRDKIPAFNDIVRDIDCMECNETFRQYLPDPFEECPNCGNPIVKVIQDDQ